MRARLLCLALLLPLLGCSLTVRNPKACLFDGTPVCPSGMICDPVQNACVASSSATDAGTGGDDGSPQCVGLFCPDSPAFALGDLSGIWGSGQSDVWVTETMGAIDRWDGTSWTQLRAPGGPALYAIAGVNSQLIWAVGGSGTILNANYEPPIRTYTDARMAMSYTRRASPTSLMLGTLPQVMSICCAFHGGGLLASSSRAEQAR